MDPVMAVRWANLPRRRLSPHHSAFQLGRDRAVLPLIRGVRMFRFRGKDIPVKEWCSVTEALEWISFKIPPVPSSFSFQPRSSYKINDVKQSEMNQILRDAKSVLFSYAANEFVNLRGKRALGENCKIIHRHTDPYADNKNVSYINIICDGFGDYEIIPVSAIIAAGKGGLTEDGFLYFDGDVRSFAFTNIEVYFRQLVERQPPPNDLTLQIGVLKQAAILAMPADDSVTSAHVPSTSQEVTPQAQSPAYLDPNHPNYSPKLAAAIAAWEALNADPALFKFKPPKTAALEWLTDNAKRLGLIKNDGSINGLGIEEIAKVTNWRPTGGPPRTPGG